VANASSQVLNFFCIIILKSTLQKCQIISNYTSQYLFLFSSKYRMNLHGVLLALLKQSVHCHFALNNARVFAGKYTIRGDESDYKPLFAFGGFSEQGRSRP